MGQASSILPGMNNLHPDAKRLGQKKIRPSGKAFARILSYAGRQRKYLAAVIAIATIGCAIEVTAPFLMSRAIDAMVGPGQVDIATIATVIITLLLMYAVSAGFARLVNYLSGIVAAKTAAEIRDEGFSRMSRLPLSFYDHTSHGDILSRFVNDVDAISDGLLQGLVQLVTGIATMIGTMIFMLVMSARMTLIVLPAAFLTFLIATFMVKVTGKFFQKQQAYIGELDGLVEEVFGGQREVKAFGREVAEQENFEKINQRLKKVGRRAQFVSSLPNPTTRFVNHGAFILIGVFGWIAGGLSIGSIAGFLSYWTSFSRPLNDITNITSQVMAAFASAERVFALIDETKEIEDPVDATDLVPEDVRGEVEFDGVFFAYEKERPLIEDFSLRVSPGQRIAIVGPTGAGKTTMINLLMRFYDPDAGVIRVDGHDTRQITRASLRRSFGMVLQETWLFTGTVRDNLRYGRPDATDEDVIAAAKAVHAHGFIKRLSQGYDTVIGETGGTLSAGQRQLLTIARALVADPAMLILDEATSSVDSLTEQRIQDAFALLMKGRTSFVIAHRLSTIKTSDHILVMRHGRVIEQGTHQELLAARGFYYDLYESQFA